jgi:hypothetical protein
MKLFKHLLIAPAALGLLSPIAVNATEVNFDDISNYSEIEEIDLDVNSFKSLPSNKQLLISGGEGLVDSQDYGDSFSSTTSASFGADFVIGSVDGAGISAGVTDGKEATTFTYQYGMNLSTSFTGEDSLDLTIETGNSSATGAAAILDMNAFGDKMTVDGISYTFPLGDKTTALVGDSTDVSALYATSCTYSAFTDLLSNCGSGTAAGLEGGTDAAGTASSATAALAYDFGNGFTLAGGISGAGGDSDGLFTKESLDVYGIQAAYNTDSYGVSLSYALKDTSATAETTFWGLNAFYSFEGEGLPSISVGYETEDPSATAEETGYFVGLTWPEVGDGSFSIGMSSTENFKGTDTEYYQYEAAYAYPINDGMTITPGVFIKEGTTDQTGILVKTSFSF